MKKLFLFLFSLIFSIALFAQDEETLFDGEFTSGGFGGVSLKYSEVDNAPGFLVGGYGGWLINHRLLIGGGGWGLVNKLKSPIDSSEVSFGYGGFMIEYIHNPNKIYHFTGSLLIGAGGLSKVKDFNNFGDNNRDSFFVFEPALGVETNITRYFRIAAGVSYRFVSNVNSYGFTDNDLKNTTFNITFKFGKF